MKIELILKLNDTPYNRKKAKALNPLEVMFDDSENEFGNFENEHGFIEEGGVFKWGKSYKITITENEI